MSSLLRRYGRLVLTGLALASSVLAQGQGVAVPDGAETPFALAGDQIYPSLNQGASGGILAWQDNAAGTNGVWTIRAQRLDAAGNRTGTPFRVGQSVVTVAQERPQAVVLPGGGAAFVWQSGKIGFQTVNAQFMTASGDMLRQDLVVSKPALSLTNRFITALPVVRNNRTTVRRFLVTRVVQHLRDFSLSPTVTTLGDGSVAVAYAGYFRMNTNEPVVLPYVMGYGSMYVTNSILIPFNRAGMDDMMDVYVRRYTPAGVPIGNEMRLNQFRKYNQRNVSLAALSGGGFIAVWISENQGLSDDDLNGGNLRQDVYARLFDNAALPLGDEFMVNRAASPLNGFPSVAAHAGGGFRVAWEQGSTNAIAGLDIVTALFAADSTPIGHPVALTSRYGDQYGAKVAACASGDMVLWTSMGQDGSREGIYGVYIPSGGVAGAELPVNTTTLGAQYHPAVTAFGDQVLAVWSGMNRASGFDINARRFTVTTP